MVSRMYTLLIGLNSTEYLSQLQPISQKWRTTALFFKHIISKFGIPRQVVSDRDTRWCREFWKEICEKMGMTRSLTVAYCSQANGQTEVLNQSLEISLCAYVGPS
jgi:transposase InsO family protein